MFLEVSGISKQGESEFVLKDIQFTQKRFQKVVIAGETGSGKSTLLKIVAGLVQPDSGEVKLQGEKIKGPEEKLVPGHPSIAYLSQHFELPHSLRVEQVLTYANVLEDDEAKQLYEICQIDHLLQRRTNQLSGGERQRIALCRLLITSPVLLLLDEPYSHLDMVHKNTLKKVIDDIVKKLKITCVLVSHDPSDTLPWANQIIVLKGGEVIQKGTSEKIYFKPVNEYVAGLFGKYNLLSGGQVKALNGSSKKQMIIRPEELIIQSKKGKHNKAIVTDVNFFGGFYELEIQWNDQRLMVRSAAPYEIGATVYLSLNLDN
jgi:ABC-type Fe3+/spermidine/putrescine transport system ATPase subunit